MSMGKNIQNKTIKAKNAATRFERQTVQKIANLLNKHRGIGEKRLRELTVLAARSVSPQLGRAMEKALIHKDSGSSIKKAKMIPTGPIARSNKCRSHGDGH